MNQGMFANLPLWAMPLDIGAHALAGLGLGWLYFSVLWWKAHYFAQNGSIAAIGGLALARFAVLGVVLALVSLEGAPPLLAAALGVFIARSVMVRRFGAVTP